LQSDCGCDSDDGYDDDDDNDDDENSKTNQSPTAIIRNNAKPFR
jgi:hypothetical protein